MPQGSDFYQKKMKQEYRDRCDIERVCTELEELRLRVRQLEDIVESMAKKLEIKPATNWNFWK